MKLTFTARRKKSTIVTSKQTVEQALQEADALAEQWNDDDPRHAKLQNAVDLLTTYLNKGPQEMMRDGVSSIEEYFDDAVQPDVATQIKREVDMIAKWRREAKTTQAPPVVASTGNLPWVTDRDEKGEPKAPEEVKVPRVAAKKAAPPVVDPAPMADPAAPPTPPEASGNLIDFIPTDALIKVIEDMAKEEDFAQNKQKQDALIELTKVLKSRPIEPMEPEGGEAAAPVPAPVAPAMPMAASAKTADENPAQASVSLGGLSVAQPESGPEPVTAAMLQMTTPSKPAKPATEFVENIPQSQPPITASATTGEPAGDFVKDIPQSQPSVSKEADAPEGWEGTVKEMKKDKDIDNPWALSNWMKNKGYESHKGSANAWKKIQAAMYVDLAEQYAKTAAGNGQAAFVYNEDTMKVKEDGGRTPEIPQAHAAREDHTGIDLPDTTLPIKLKDQAVRKEAASEEGKRHDDVPVAPTPNVFQGGDSTKAEDKMASKTAAMATSRALKEAEKLGEDLKKLYLGAKALTEVNDTRPVREAVEAIFRAADMFDEAVKVLSKMQMQEESEAEAAKIKDQNKGKKSSFLGLFDSGLRSS